MGVGAGQAAGWVLQADTCAACHYLGRRPAAAPLLRRPACPAPATPAPSGADRLPSPPPRPPQVRVRHSAVSARPLDYVADGKRLLEVIQQYA